MVRISEGDERPARVLFFCGAAQNTHADFQTH
jgi:hypothetical protein